MILLGGMAILGVIAAQSFYLFKTWDVKDNDFDQSVRIALRNVASYIAKFNNTTLPKSNLIQRKSSNYYAVRVNSTIDANILEDYLYQELSRLSINTDFEYAVYDCFSEDLVYGSYCKMSTENKEHKISSSLPKLEGLEYYFVVKFPSRESFLLSNMKTNLFFAGVALLSMAAFMYSIFVILRQKRVSELQKDFINNMTHEFKTPIASIKIASNVLSASKELQTSKRLSKYISIIQEQNNRLNNQVEKVLNVAKMENESFRFNIEQIDLVELIRHVVEAEQIRLSNGHIFFTSNRQQIEIEADRLHLSNVIHNIIDNATKYCDKHPQINITIRQHNQEVCVEIQDNGLGISKENQQLVFNKFFRVSTGNIHNVKGFGLGLFYVKQVCDSHGWEISLKSRKNEGTTFIITIPLTVKKEKSV